MYSLQAIADGSANHFGFYATLVMAGFLGYHLLKDDDITRKEFIVAVLAVAVTLGLVATGSFYDKPPINERVTAIFEGYSAEVEHRTTGKIHTDEHRLYGSFRVPEGVIALEVSAGVPIADKVILYKN